MRIIYMGTPDFAVAPLKKMLEAGHEVCAVVTQPDKQRGRGKEVSFTPVKACALQYGIPVLQPVRVREEATVEELRKYQADIFVVAAFGQILSEEILQMPPYGCINIHASLLPRYRGAAPIQRAILNGDQETGVTIMQMARGVDTGDMLLQQSVPIEEWETGDSLHDKLSTVGAELILRALEEIEGGTVQREKQEEEKACYASMLKKEDGRIRWEMSAGEIERQVRGLNSWPSAYTSYQGKTLKIWRAMAESEESGGRPGTVVQVSGDSIWIAAGEGCLRIEELQLEGKKRMPAKDFLRGFPIPAGTELG